MGPDCASLSLQEATALFQQKGSLRRRPSSGDLRAAPQRGPRRTPAPSVCRHGNRVNRKRRNEEWGVGGGTRGLGEGRQVVVVVVGR